MDMNDLARRLIAPLKPYFLSFDGTRDLGRGAAFPLTADLPGGLQTNDRFFRTDLGWLCYYDGTRWLTVHEYSAAFMTSPSLAQPYSGGLASLLLTVPRASHQIFTTYVRLYGVVSTLNNATNYWSFSLNADASVLYTANTSAGTINTNLFYQSALTSANGPNLFTVDVSKTGAPGALTLSGSMWYRLVVT